MSATFPTDVFTSTPVSGEWVPETAKPVHDVPGCYVSMNREFGARPTLETVHECYARTDWNCPVGLLLELETAELEDEINDYWN